VFLLAFLALAHLALAAWEIRFRAAALSLRVGLPPDERLPFGRVVPLECGNCCIDRVALVLKFVQECWLCASTRVIGQSLMEEGFLQEARGGVKPTHSPHPTLALRNNKPLALHHSIISHCHNALHPL
jgi:hypothetical protein